MIHISFTPLSPHYADTAARSVWSTKNCARRDWNSFSPIPFFAVRVSHALFLSSAVFLPSGGAVLFFGDLSRSPCRSDAFPFRSLSSSSLLSIFFSLLSELSLRSYLFISCFSSLFQKFSSSFSISVPFLFSLRSHYSRFPFNS